MLLECHWTAYMIKGRAAGTRDQGQKLGLSLSKTHFLPVSWLSLPMFSFILRDRLPVFSLWQETWPLEAPDSHLPAEQLQQKATYVFHLASTSLRERLGLALLESYTHPLDYCQESGTILLAKPGSHIIPGDGLENMESCS